ncbi:penicillin-binding protein [Listeria costaricensis]|uniref:penicillin-binding protein n=1 Tax=Listeria costaricensis TaxID=2026604 RepID=UPI000C069333|nr:penicillin-binding transpeptidase domain-containing protein [Listeria costaricensis]
MKRRIGNMRRGALVLFIFFAALFLIVTGRFLYLEITGMANGQPLAAEAAQQHQKSQVIEANRGSILDRNGDVIAEDTATYTLAAVVSNKTANGTDNPMYVKDKEKTAKVLAKYIPMSEEDILKRLNTKDAYQVEFGKAGKNLSSETKEKIEAENLPGLTFTRTPQRFYPNGTFSSQLIGFAQQQENKDGSTTLEGKMGIEQSYNDVLNGKNGKVTYSTDSSGYILPNADKNVKEAEDGSDIQLTIDKKIQTFLEDTMSTVQETYNPKNMMAVVMNPKTGEILAMSQRPSFNPEDRSGLDSSSDGIWQDLPVEYAYEPGSVMKIFTLASAIDSGVYDPNAYYQSGTYKVGDITIHDHNNGVGWGNITYREGVERSSNVAFANLLDKMGTDTFYSYLTKFGFGQKTGINLPNEATGQILYNYPVEKVTTAFGQGTTVTMMQMIQGASAIASDGKMKQPYVVSSVTDPNTGKSDTTKTTVTGQPISAETAKKTREELTYVVNGENGTGKLYQIPGYTVAGKTGTSQIPDPTTGKYMTGDDNYIFSFMGMAPADDPELVMYVTIQQPQLKTGQTGGQAVADVFNPVMKNSLQYMNIEPADQAKLNSVSVPDVTSKSVDDAKKAISDAGLEPVIVGNGQKIVQQSSASGDKVLQGGKVILMTDGDMTMPDMTSWSKDDALKVSEITGVPFTFSGSGYVTKQNISAGSVINEASKVEITLGNPADISTYNQNHDTSSTDSSDSGTDINENAGVGDLLTTGGG